MVLLLKVGVPLESSHSPHSIKNRFMPPFFRFLSLSCYIRLERRGAAGFTAPFGNFYACHGRS